jgi:glycosyltransferase involved in cell wall biosynthesis
MTFPNRNSKLKILFIASWYPNEDNQLSGIFIKRHAKAVSKYCDVCVLYVHMSQHRNGLSIESTMEDGVKTIRVYNEAAKPSHLMNVWGALKYYYSGWRGLKAVKKEFGKPDLIHANVIRQAGILALLINLVTGIPYVLTEHSSDFKNHYSSKFYKFICYKILKRAKKIMPVSHSLETNMRKLYNENKYQVIPNGVDTDGYKPVIKFERHVRQILHVSMLNDHQKNVSGIIKAILDLSNHRKDFELHIVGDGPDIKSLKNLSGNFLNSKIFFHGRVSDQTLKCMMTHADFFVLNSRSETFSIVCAEALSAGIPVITTECGGPEEFVNEDCGILIESDNHPCLVSAMEWMLDNHEKYDPEKLHNYIENKFSYETVGSMIYDVYQSL